MSYSTEFSTIFHRAVSVWQERPLEMSWQCSCGLIHKHQAFGDLRCADDEQVPLGIWVYGPDA